MNRFVFILAFVVAFVAAPLQAQTRLPDSLLANEVPQLSEAQVTMKKQKANEILSKEKINFNGRWARDVLFLQEKAFYSYNSWGVCYKMVKLKADFSVNAYGNIEVSVHRRDGFPDCLGMKLVIDPDTLQMSAYDVDTVSQTLSGPAPRHITSIE